MKIFRAFRLSHQYFNVVFSDRQRHFEIIQRLTFSWPQYHLKTVFSSSWMFVQSLCRNDHIKSLHDITLIIKKLHFMFKFLFNDSIFWNEFAFSVLKSNMRQLIDVCLIYGKRVNRLSSVCTSPININCYLRLEIF